MLTVFLFSVFLVSYSYAHDGSPDDIFLKNRPIILSLGSQCEITSKINQFGKRDASFLFDWILSVNVKGVIDLLNNDFKDFFDERYFELHPYHANILVHRDYGFEYRHEWSEHANFWKDFSSYKERYPLIKAMYERRINRFRRLGQFNGKVFFIRAAFNTDNEERIVSRFAPEHFRISHKNAIDLRNALRRHFPFLNFTLVIINYREQSPIDLVLDEADIIEFKFSKNRKDADYDKMFHTLLDPYDKA